MQNQFDDTYNDQDYFRFAAFLSYSSKDAKFAKRLHRDLETYHIPSALGDFDLTGDGKKNRIFPIYLDSEEQGAGDLGPRLKSALKQSRFLIVVCSRNASRSTWVNLDPAHQ